MKRIWEHRNETYVSDILGEREYQKLSEKKKLLGNTRKILLGTMEQGPRPNTVIFLVKRFKGTV